MQLNQCQIERVPGQDADLPHLLGQGDRSAPHLSPHLHIDSGHQYNIFDISKIFNVQLYMALMSVWACVNRSPFPKPLSVLSKSSSSLPFWQTCKRRPSETWFIFLAMCRNQLTKGWLIVQHCSQKKESTLLRQVESQRRLPMVGPGPTGGAAGRSTRAPGTDWAAGWEWKGGLLGPRGGSQDARGDHADRHLDEENHQSDENSWYI